MASLAPQHYPDHPQFSDFMKPCRFEGEVQNLEVHGNLPNDIDGTFYRVMPDPQLPPFIDNDPWFNGDGNVSAFRIKDGSVSFQQRYVRTEKFVREREAGRALLGKYRNKFTDAVEFAVRSTANTNIVSFNSQLLALKEDSPPYAMDPETLETKGLYTFEGQLPSLTFTAHPKTDPATGELICFGYEAKGDGSPDICYYTIGPDVTENWLCDLERMKQGGEHWQWSPETPFYIGVIPRHGAKTSDVKWFTYKNSFPGHTANAYEQDDGKILFDLGLSDKNVFYWWPDAQGNSPDPSKLHSQLTRFTVDPKAEEKRLPEPQVLHGGNSEFYRIDDRFMGRKYSHSYFDLMDPSLGTDFAAIGPVMGGGYPPYNSLAHHDESTGKTEVYFPGCTHLVQEPVFIPRVGSTEEGDGYLMALVNNYRTLSSELHLLDCQDFTKARAIILLPLRLRAGLHGNWVDKN
ncbi:Carotenoid oxygenase [Penicillium antarcticum]|uniref:Carotenoid oxygenase n=1 Tax=Penicillium antarcticum TaxID=416450 RepID=UPI002393C87F|nr:Carotenoid oxygenase [Penicillium antarcticum]KAJ5317838.1 Carotenoid oxygenase [Penicillium antarcticum]